MTATENGTTEMTIEQAQELLEKSYPKKGAEIRRVHHLFDMFFRVNFHDADSNNKIVRSYFVCIRNGQVKER